MTIRDRSDARQTETTATVVSVVLPCLNEERSVGECIDEASAALRAAGLRYEIVVVDNNCTDRSVEVAVAHGGRVVHQPIPGYGSAVRAGIEAASGDIVVIADADLTYDLSKINRLVQPVLDGAADIVIGERFRLAHSSAMPFLHRRVGTPTLNFLVNRASEGLAVTDSQSGYRAFRRESIRSLRLASTGMEFASEMLIRAAREGLRIEEVSTGYRARVGESKLNALSDGLRHVRQILALAPWLMLVGPGAALVVFGVVMLVLGWALIGGVALVVAGFGLVYPSVSLRAARSAACARLR